MYVLAGDALPTVGLLGDLLGLALQQGEAIAWHLGEVNLNEDVEK